MRGLSHSWETNLLVLLAGLLLPALLSALTGLLRLLLTGLVLLAALLPALAALLILLAALVLVILIHENLLGFPARQIPTSAGAIGCLTPHHSKGVCSFAHNAGEGSYVVFTLHGDQAGKPHRRAAAGPEAAVFRCK